MTWKLGAELSFKFADMFFKFVTWLFALAALHYLARKAPGFPLNVLVVFSNAVYTIALMITCFRMLERNPSEIGMKGRWVYVCKAGEIILAMGALSILMSPFLYEDQLIEAIISASHHG